VASPRYPLERVRELRADAATDRLRDLASGLADETAAEAAVARAREGVDRLRAALAAPDDAGPQPAWALAQREAYRARLRRDLAQAERRLADADATLAARRASTDAARDRAAHARAERDAVDRHRADWDTAQRQTRERREE
jgi:hypothetical protein